MAELQVEKPKEEIVLNEDPVEEPESLDADRIKANGGLPEQEPEEDDERIDDEEMERAGFCCDCGWAHESCRCRRLPMELGHRSDPNEGRAF